MVLFRQSWANRGNRWSFLKNLFKIKIKIAAKMNRARSQMGKENAIICCGAGGGGGLPETGHYFILEHFLKNSLLTKKGIQF